MNAFNYKIFNVKKVFCEIAHGMKFQSVIISDSQVFDIVKFDKLSWKQMIRIFPGYLFYLLPSAGILGMVLFAKSDSYVCRPMKARFLVDNQIQPANNLTFSELYYQRQIYGKEAKLHTLQTSQ